MSPRDMAHAAFWTDHPLCRLYALAHGRWISPTTFEPATSWSIKKLIEFAEALPAPVIANLERPT